MKRWIALSLSTYGFFLVLLTPSSVLSFLVNNKAKDRAVLTAEQGSFWNGLGSLTVIGAASRGTAFSLEWQFLPLSLWRGRAEFLVRARGEGASLNGIATLGRNTMGFRQMKSEVPAAWSSLMFPQLTTLAPEGRLKLEADSFEVGKRGVKGAVVVALSDASATGLGRLGSYRARIFGTGSKTDIQIDTPETSNLKVTGTGFWQPGDGAARLDLSLSCSSNNTVLSGALAALGPEIDGQRRFSIAGQVPLNL